MNRPSAGRKQGEKGFQARQTLQHPALADEHVGESMPRPRVSRGDAERAFRPRLGVTKVVAQLAGEGRHGEKIRIGSRAPRPTRAG